MDRKAAEQGNTKALYALVVLYEEEVGVTQDYATALEIYQLLASKGNIDADKKVGELQKKIKK